MSVISIQRDLNSNVCFVRIISTDNLATISQANYIANNQDSINVLNGGIFGWFMTDMLLVSANDGNALFQFTDETFTSLIIYGEQGSGIINPGLANEIAFYPANGTSLSGLTTAANGVLATSALGVPSISQFLPSAVQTNITNLGTITVGTWAATIVDVPVGGTGTNSFTPYTLVCGGATSTGPLQNVSSVGTAGDVLLSNGPGMLPSFQTGVAAGIINTGGLNDLAFYSTNPTGKTLSALTTSSNSVLTTSGFGVPNWVSTLPLSLGGTNASLVGSAGSVVYSASSALALSAVGSSGQIFQSTGTTAPVWTSATYPSTTTINRILYSSATNTVSEIVTANNGVLITSNAGIPSFLANSSTPGFVLTANSGAPPSWQSITAEGAITTIDGDTGNITPTAGVVTISGGTTGLTTSGSGSTLDLTGTLKLANGGTNANLTASNGGIFYSTSTAGAILSGTATANQVLLSGSSAAPAWSTATYPSTTTINQLLYSSSNNVIAGLSTANNGTLITSNTGVPSISSTLPNAVQDNITRLGTVTNGIWHASVIAEIYGGTNQSTYILGDILYSSAANTLSKLPGNITTGIQYLAQTGTGAVSAAPVWTTITGGDITGAALTKTDDTNVTLTLGGTPTTALLRAASLTLGWTGQLGLTRGGTAASLTASNGGVVYSTASALAILAGTATANQLLLSGASTTPSWSTSTYPTTNAINTLLYASASNVMSALSTANNSVLLTNGSGVPAWVSAIVASQLLPLGGSGVSFIGSTTRNLTTASGTQAITGVGFLPSLVIFLTNVSGTAPVSIGFDNGTAHVSIFNNHAASSNTWGDGTTFSIALVTAAGASQTATITAFGSDGFTLTWVKTGSPSGTGTILFLAFK